VAVRAIAPVAGSPPNIGGDDISHSLRHQFDVSDCGGRCSCGPTTTADISDSIAPSMAEPSEAGSDQSHGSAQDEMPEYQDAAARWESRPKRVPMVRDRQVKEPDNGRSPAPSATIAPGIRGEIPRQMAITKNCAHRQCPPLRKKESEKLCTRGF